MKQDEKHFQRQALTEKKYIAKAKHFIKEGIDKFYETQLIIKIKGWSMG